MNMAKELMMADPKYAKGFKFEHVWEILKDFNKFNCKSQKNREDTFPSSQSDTPVPESPLSPDSTPSFPINLSDDSGSGSASKCPMGVKKSKLKKKEGENFSHFVNSLLDSNQKMQTLFEESTAINTELQQKKTVELQRANDFAQWDADNKILMMDTSLIPNAASRLYFEQEQARILQKRANGHPPNDFNFGSYFPDMGGPGSGSGSGSGLGEY